MTNPSKTDRSSQQLSSRQAEAFHLRARYPGAPFSQRQAQVVDVRKLTIQLIDAALRITQDMNTEEPEGQRTHSEEEKRRSGGGYFFYN